MTSKILLLVGTALLAGHVSADPMLVGLSTRGPASLYSIDPTSGAATLLVQVNSVTSSPGLEALHGRLYATDVYAGASTYSFGTIDIASGIFTAINNQGGSANWQGLAANESTGLFYTIDMNDGNKLKTVTASGTITTIGSGTGVNGRGLAYDDALGILYATGGATLYSVDTTTGASTMIGHMGDTIAHDRVGLAFDEVSRVLYLSDASYIDDAWQGNLYSVSTVTGQATLIGSTGPVGIDGLAWLAAPLPDPGALLQQLLDDVTDVGPGKTLANKVKLAQTYYAAGDIPATCAVMADFVTSAQQFAAGRKPKLSTTLAAQLVADANAIMAAIGCD